MLTQPIINASCTVTTHGLNHVMGRTMPINSKQADSLATLQQHIDVEFLSHASESWVFALPL